MLICTIRPISVIKMIEFEMAEDLKALVTNNEDVKISPNDMVSLMKMHNMDLIKVDMEIKGGIVINSIELVDEEWVKNHLG